MSRTKKAKRKKEKIFDLYPEGKFFPMPYKIMKFLIKELEGREQELFYYIARWTYGFRKFGKYQFCFKWHGTTKVAEAIDMNSIVNISKYIKRLKDKHAIIEWKVGFNNRWFAINPAILTGSDRKSKEEEILEIIDVPDYELKINTDGKLFYDEEMDADKLWKLESRERQLQLISSSNDRNFNENVYQEALTLRKKYPKMLAHRAILNQITLF